MTEIETLRDLVQWQSDVAALLKDLKRADRQIANWDLKRAQAIKGLMDLGAPLPTTTRPLEDGAEVVDFATIEYVKTDQEQP